MIAGRIEHYALALGTNIVLKGAPQTLSAAPRGPFRPNALIINARTPTSRWARILSALFGWVRIPLPERGDGFWEWYYH